MSYPQMPRPDAQPPAGAEAVDLGPALQLMEQSLTNLKAAQAEGWRMVDRTKAELIDWEKRVTQTTARVDSLQGAISRLKAGGA